MRRLPIPKYSGSKQGFVQHLLVYRCGGSVGIAVARKARRTDFPFHSSRRMPSGAPEARTHLTGAGSSPPQTLHPLAMNQMECARALRNPARIAHRREDEALTRFPPRAYHLLMEKEISQLEERASRLLSEYQSLRDENRGLHARLDAVEADNAKLRDKLTQCIARVEALIARLPEREDV